MPELPEVETVRLTLAPQLLGRRIRDLAVLHPDVVAGTGVATDDFRARLVGAEFSALRRRGKYLIIGLRAPEGPLRLVLHLRMTGRLVVVPAAEEVPKHTHLRFVLDDGRELRFTDPRRFGRACLLPGAGGRDGPRGLRELGPEPLAAGFSAAELGRRMAGRKVRLKALLLDQRFVAGVGNIYADETLFRAGLHPAQRACDLDETDVRRLHRQLRRVLRQAIGQGGTTIRDYVDGRGRRGEFALALQVYGREGEACGGCGTMIERAVIAGRSTRFCPRCQALKAPNGAP
ncbi:MAG: bifunctional DNA-formamidopyrimidine glycosylase/DNA-(apurinic or apyrimidinic site) lyase [Bacillota bacterium]|nr:bifunctional DNA-formamidopyrimidine glycosylase/DNA-(apurinic or apyrimidinic site) lyase [Bacillota bacterium]